MVIDFRRKRRDHRAPLPRHPTFPPVVHDPQFDLQLVNAVILIALEARAGRHAVGLDDPIFVHRQWIGRFVPLLRPPFLARLLLRPFFHARRLGRCRQLMLRRWWRAAPGWRGAAKGDLIATHLDAVEPPPHVSLPQFARIRPEPLAHLLSQGADAVRGGGGRAQ
jgi:hypothetical protein